MLQLHKPLQWVYVYNTMQYNTEKVYSDKVHRKSELSGESNQKHLAISNPFRNHSESSTGMRIR